LAAGSAELAARWPQRYLRAMTRRNLLLLATVGASALISGVVLMQGGSERLPAHATILDEERDGEMQVVTFRSDRDALEAWLASEALDLVPEQMAWTRGEVEDSGEVYAASHGAGQCSRLVHLVPETHLAELFEGCSEAGARAVAAMRDQLTTRPTHDEVEEESFTLPALWSPEALGVSHCERESAEVGRTVYDFDEQGRLLRERTWRAPPGEEDIWEWRVMRWTYDAEGGFLREESRRPYGGPWHRAEWLADSVRVEARVEGAWVHHQWTYEGGAEERQYRLENGRLAGTGGDALDGECTFDGDGRPLVHTDEDMRVEWRYRDGLLSEVERRGFGDVMTTAVEIGSENDLIVEEDHFRGDCAEVVFWQCSAVMKGLGHPLPVGLLPRPERRVEFVP
jgi:hypothetical protein